MVRPKSDDDLDDKDGIEPDAGTRPGVYVQVSNTPRRRKGLSKLQSQESGDHAVEETRGAHPPVRRGPGPMGMGAGTAHRSEPTRALATAEPARARGQIKEINQSFPDSRAESENTNYRAAILRVSSPAASMSQPPQSQPPQSRRPSMPSVLDAPPRLHSDPTPVARTPWGLIALVAIMSSIIAAAGAVALFEWRLSSRPREAAVAPEVLAPPPSLARVSVPAEKAPLPPAAVVAPAVVAPAVVAPAVVAPAVVAPVAVAPAVVAAPAGAVQAVPEFAVVEKPHHRSRSARVAAPVGAVSAPEPVAPAAAPLVGPEEPSPLPANPFEPP